MDKTTPSDTSCLVPLVKGDKKDKVEIRALADTGCDGIYFAPVTKVYNKSTEKQKRSELRRQMPQAEAILWSQLQKRQVLGFKFRCQYSIGAYVLDFFCPEARLAVEIDGDSHFRENAAEYDGNRQASIEELGIRFLRFTNLEIHENLFEVLEAIRKAVRETGKQNI